MPPAAGGREEGNPLMRAVHGPHPFGAMRRTATSKSAVLQICEKGSPSPLPPDPHPLSLPKFFW